MESHFVSLFYLQILTQTNQKIDNPSVYMYKLRN